MTIDIRQKGAEGEREVCKMLNSIIVEVMTSCGFPADSIAAATQSVQRNSNQSAVGGNDLCNTFGMSIEIKRQEALSIGTWWKQCKAAAERNNELPVLMYRQNRKPWHVVTYAFLHVPGSEPDSWSSQQVIAQFDIDQFKSWFRAWVLAKLEQGSEVRS